MNPMVVAQNRTARLAAEASAPVYTTDTRTAAAQARMRTLRAADALAGEDFCHVCGRCTDHRGEHSDEQLLAFARSGLGKFLMRME